jgi:uncharacterized membrane protein YgdD (TMEM256/DUF423 family)
MVVAAWLRPTTLFISGVLGLAGVAMAAYASHGPDARLIATASTMCLAHAPVLIALYAAWPSIRTAPVAAVLLMLGTLLFAGDLVSRQFLGTGLFPMSAPLGGLLMIAGWVAVAVSAFLPSDRSGRSRD